MNELAGLVIGFILTLFIYSYLVGDNPLYRLAVHLLVGVSAAYAAVVVMRQVILPVLAQISRAPGEPHNLLWLAPLLLGILLLFKRLPTLGWLSNNAVAFLVGIGAAVALTGAIAGTLWPQVTAVPGPDRLFPGQGMVVALFTVCTLLTFQFTGRMERNNQWKRPFWLQSLVTIGRFVLMITFGVLFASVLNSSIILLADRLSYYLSHFLQQVL